MKANKFLSMTLMLVLALSTALSFSSCSKDDDGGSTSPELLTGGQWIGTITPNNAPELTIAICFYDDGTYVYECFEEGIALEGDWQAKNGKIYITGDIEDEVKYSVKGDKLIVRSIITKDKCTLTRVYH